MKTFLMILLASFMVFGSSKAMMDMDDGGFTMIMMEAMMMITDHMKSAVDVCPDPVPFISHMYGMICEVENCRKIAFKCTKALMPPGGICPMLRECLPSNEEVQTNMNLEDMKDMGNCMMKEMMEAFDLDYIPNDNKGNVMAFIEEAYGNNRHITPVARDQIVAAIRDDACIVPESFLPHEKMKFESCVINTCVEAMAG